jgi:hypothetical protein
MGLLVLAAVGFACLVLFGPMSAHNVRVEHTQRLARNGVPETPVGSMKIRRIRGSIQSVESRFTLAPFERTDSNAASFELISIPVTRVYGDRREY